NGFDPKSHEGVYALLNLHFVKTGTLDKKYSRLFEHLHKAREIADYNPLAPKYDREDADGYLRAIQEGVPEIVKMIGNFRKVSGRIIKSVEELEILSRNAE
ncbi:MAG: HEPN domain-containing protein, partial [Nitrospirae bacterium]|nr:HEPN domain-containing protein [Nitrospirota bacterium]